MIIKHKIQMDLALRGTPQRLNMVQCDSGARAVELILTEHGAPWSPGDVNTVLVRYRKSDGTGGSYDTLSDGTKAWILEENLLTVLMADQVLTVPGLVEVQFALLSGTACAATFGLQIVVEADPALGTVKSEDYINWTHWALSELDQRLMQARDSGEFDGVTFFPKVDGEGNLCWSNEKDAENPAPVNIVALLENRLAEDMLVRRSGDTMQGDLNMAGFHVTGLAAPEDASDAVTKSYSDAIFRKKTVTLLSVLWSGNQMAAQVSGVTAENLVMVTPEPDSMEICTRCGVHCTAQGENLLTFSCETVPTQTVRLNVVVFLRGETE